MKKKYLNPEFDAISLLSREIVFTSVDADQPDESDPGFPSLPPNP